MRAIQLGVVVSKHIFEGARYDYVIDIGGKVSRARSNTLMVNRPESQAQFRSISERKSKRIRIALTLKTR
jgi:hypothetical protein